MINERPPRRLGVRDAAEAVFKPATKTPDPAPKAAVIPGARELVSLRIDQDVLQYFQDEGPGWQDRVNAALRRAAGLDAPATGKDPT